MIPSENAVVLGDCFDEKAYVTLSALGSNTYNMYFEIESLKFQTNPKILVSLQEFGIIMEKTIKNYF